MRSSRRRQRRRPGARTAAAAALAVLVALSACDPDTGPAPAPSPSPTAPAEPSPSIRIGLRVGVVLAPPGAGVPSLVGPAIRRATETLREHSDLTLSSVRVLQPETEAFRRDEVTLLADERYDLVCTVGPGGIGVVIELAPQYPTTRFCLLDAELPDPPANVIVVTWRDEEGAYVAGAAAALAAGGGGAGVLVGIRDVAADRFRAGFEAGARQARPAVPLAFAPVVRGADVSVEDAAAALARERLTAERSPTRALVPYGGPETLTAVTEVAAQESGAIVGWGRAAGDVVDAELESTVVLTVAKRFGDVLARVAALATQPPAGPMSVGFADGAFEVVPGAHASTPVVVPRARELADAIATGGIQVSPSAPPAPPPAPAPAPATDAASPS